MNTDLPHLFPPESPRGWKQLYLRTVSRRSAAWVILAVCLITTGIVTSYSLRQLHARMQQQFEAETQALQNAILDRLERYVQVLRGAGGLFAASQSVERNEWRDYFKSLDLADRYRGLMALGYIEKVSRDDLLAFRESVRSERDDSFGLADFRVWPLTNHSDYYAVKFVEPLSRNRNALGFDIGSEEARRQGAETARDTGRATLTRKIELVQAPLSPGLLLLLPIYNRGVDSISLEERRANLQGWVYAAFVMEDLMKGLSQRNRREPHFEIFDGVELSEETLLFRDEAMSAPGWEGDVDALQSVVRLDCEGRTWSVRFHSRAGLPKAASHWIPHLFALGGLFLSLLLFSIFRSLATNRQRAISLAHDMTTQLRLQERAITSSDAGIFILDATSQNSPIIYANPAFTRITGYSVEDHIGEETIVLLHGTAMQSNLSALRSIHKSKTGKSSILREYRKDGTQFWAELSLSPVCNEAGRVTHYVGIVNDVTRRRQAELALSEREESLKLALEELKASHKELKVTQLQLIQSAKLESIGTLAAGVAHEVKNPLQTMLMGLEFVSNNLNGNREELAEAMDDMKEAVTRANGIIQELLQMTAASKLTLQGEDFNAVVHRSCRLLNSEIMASRVEVVFQLQENLPPALIDKSKMEQVLINLILNAIQAITPAQGGSITISTRLDRINEDFLRNSLVATQFELGESVLVASIQDTGEGISEEHLSKIFDPFFSTKVVGVGTGLGLSVVRKIIDLCHGSIDIKNVPQGGTLVTLVLKTANGSCPLIRNDSRESFHPKRPVNFAGMAAPPNPN